MSSSNSSTELSKWRTRVAAERTLLAWVRSTLTLLQVGIVTAHISKLFVHRFPGAHQAVDLELLNVLGLLSIVIALILLALALCQYKISTGSLRRLDYAWLPGEPIELASTLSVTIYGLVAVGTLLSKLW
ncbi:MAG: DUF202 domain-containing protein [Cyanobacteria bacterium P01_D01_bin.1]